MFLAASAAALVLIGRTARAALSSDDAKAFISNLGTDAISSLTGSTLNEKDRETRFRSLLVTHFDMLGISKFVLGRYWKIATPDQQTEFQKLLEDLLTQSYAKTFAQYGGEKFQVTKSWADGDGSVVVNSHVDRPNGDIIHLAHWEYCFCINPCQAVRQNNTTRMTRVADLQENRCLNAFAESSEFW